MFPSQHLISMIAEHNAHDLDVVIDVSCLWTLWHVWDKEAIHTRELEIIFE